MNNNISNQPIILSGHQYSMKHKHRGRIVVNVTEVDRPWIQGRIPGQWGTQLINLGFVRQIKQL